MLAGMGWQREDTKLVQQMASNGAEPIGSLGYDGPLASLSEERQNLADYFKETVAVVTNPAIDREREIEHFSCRAVFGARPVDRPARRTSRARSRPRSRSSSAATTTWRRCRTRSTAAVAKEHKTYLLEDLWECFRGRAGVLDISCLEAETVEGALERLKYEAAKKVLDGAELLVLSDRTAFEGERPWLDPHLALAAIDRALREYRVEPGEREPAPPHVDRAALGRDPQRARRLHGARAWAPTASVPYVMIEVICVDDYEDDISNICSALRKGIEKVISTLGIHEVRGYARLFSAIGLKPELVEIFGTPGYYGSRDRGHRLRRAERRVRRAPAHPRRAGGRQAGEDVPLLPEGLQGRDRRRERRPRRSRSTRRRCASSSTSSRSRCATCST